MRNSENEMGEEMVRFEDLKGDYPAHTQHRSRFAIGDEVLFQPDVDKIEWTGNDYLTDDSAVRAKVVRVSFIPGKVIYDLAVWVESEQIFYEVHPIRNVDSYMVLSLEPIKKGNLMGEGNNEV